MISTIMFNFLCELLFEGLCRAEANYIRQTGDAKLKEELDVRNVCFEMDMAIFEDGVYDGAKDGVGMHIGEGWIPDGWLTINVEDARYILA